MAGAAANRRTGRGASVCLRDVAFERPLVLPSETKMLLEGHLVVYQSPLQGRGENATCIFAFFLYFFLHLDAISAKERPKGWKLHF
jgi:hypothetical protein